ncbi:MAG: HipA domain-containing protein [Sulfurovum sp.]
MINIFANKLYSGDLEYNSIDREFVFNYKSDNPISLTMPYRSKSYLSKYHLHPIFDMSMPEGYLFSLLKNLLIKEYGEMDDFILFSHLSSNICGYLTYRQNPDMESILSLEEILHSKDENLFTTLINNFLNQSAIAGVQPKVLARLKDKATFSTKEYIIKTFSDEYPHLAENEYFCMMSLRYADIKTPKFWLSESKKLFIMEKFTYQSDRGEFYGFEEFCVLFGFNKEKKYSGSYEKVAKAIEQISTQKQEDLAQFFKMLVMNYLLKNGDAHLKNFGVLYTHNKEKRFLAPAYDVVNTTVYLPNDKPALTLFGKKSWVSYKKIIEFGVNYCLLDEIRALHHIKFCKEAIFKTQKEIRIYIKNNPSFEEFGEKFCEEIDSGIL